MKTFSHITAIVILLSLLSSCSESFLNQSPISDMNEEDFFESEEDFELAVNAAYQTLYTIYGPVGPLAYAEQMSDDCTLFHVSGNTTHKFQFKNYTLLADNTYVADFWNDYYNSLYIINTVIKKLSVSSLDDNLRTGYEAEMRFLRAWYYFDMVRFWGDMPLLTTPVTAKESYSIGRTSEREVYAQIVTDLVFAENNLPLRSGQSRTGQATKGAAGGLLGKVYLTLGEKSNAITYLKKVIDSEEYELLPEYSHLWDLEHENSKEALFEVQYIRGTNTPASNYWQSFSPFENTMNHGGGMNQVTEDLWNEYEQGDERRSISVNNGYYEASGAWVDALFPKKWTDENSIYISPSYRSENNFIALRYADILLMYAEATGDEAYLNEVRRRAGMSEWGSAEYPTDKYPTLDLAVEHERRSELALEFHRWFDLKRTNRAIPVLGEAKGKIIEEWQLLLPIPQSVIDQNPDLITQNTGY